MPISIAEYLGQRTDQEISNIIPVHNIQYASEEDLPKCPFNGHTCKKTAMKEYSKAPICAVRRSSGQYYIVCEHRLISTINLTLNRYRNTMLLRVAKALFHPDIRPEQVEYKREQDVMVAQGLSSDEASADMFHSADFILAVPDLSIEIFGPRRMIVEVQGGGETSSTGELSRRANEWADKHENNTFLRMPLSKAGTIQTNAWRRLQEQILGKGSTAAKTNYGFAAVIGEVVADYIEHIMPGIRDQKLDPHRDKWNLAFVVFKEVELSDLNDGLIRGAVELDIDPSRTIYTTLDRFIEAITTRGTFYPKAFEEGEFHTIEEAGVIGKIPKKITKTAKK